MKQYKSFLISIIVMIASFAVCLSAAEAILRLKNSDMANYDIEMWRYSKELKIKSPDLTLDFDHRHSVSAVLENVDIRLNEWGLRGGPVAQSKPGGRRILFLGSSMALGWGVREEDTTELQLQKMLEDSGQKIEILNGGVGNYNAKRYVSRFFSELTGLKPADIVVDYFLRDAEDIPPGNDNYLLRNSELAVSLWVACHRLWDLSGEQSLVDHYRAVYQPNAPGFREMRQQLKQLADYAHAHHIRLYLSMVPDIHNLIDYKFGFIHDIMRRIAAEDGYSYIDPLPAMQGHRFEEIWAMPGDPHPGALGHKLMAETIYPVINAPVKTP